MRHCSLCLLFRKVCVSLKATLSLKRMLWFNDNMTTSWQVAHNMCFCPPAVRGWWGTVVTPPGKKMGGWHGAQVYECDNSGNRRSRSFRLMLQVELLQIWWVWIPDYIFIMWMWTWEQGDVGFQTDTIGVSTRRPRGSTGSLQCFFLMWENTPRAGLGQTSALVFLV